MSLLWLTTKSRSRHAEFVIKGTGAIMLQESEGVRSYISRVNSLMGGICCVNSCFCML